LITAARYVPYSLRDLKQSIECVFMLLDKIEKVPLYFKEGFGVIQYISISKRIFFSTTNTVEVLRG
jgi:hypothetical protein